VKLRPCSLVCNCQRFEGICCKGGKGRHRVTLRLEALDFFETPCDTTRLNFRSTLSGKVTMTVMIVVGKGDVQLNVGSVLPSEKFLLHMRA
jgi:hypothetical protein